MMLNYGRSVSADHVSNIKFTVSLQLFIIKDRLPDTLDAKITPEMICHTFDQVYQSMLTKCSILPRYAENQPAKPKDPRQQSTKV